MRHFNWRELVPGDWGYPELSVLECQLYRVFFLPNEVPDGAADVGNVRIQLFRGVLPPFSQIRSTFMPWTSGGLGLHYERVPGSDGEGTGEEGTYLILLTPRPREAEEEGRAGALQRLRQTVGVMRLLFGRNIAFEPVFAAQLTITDGGEEFTGAWNITPNAYPPPTFATEDVKTIAAITGAAVADSRLALALRWANRAAELESEDAFLAWWIAIEVVGMPDTNVRPVRESLAAGYDVDVAKAEERFRIGRLYGLRSALVHHGEIRGRVGLGLLDYLRAVVADLVLAQVGLPLTHVEDALAARDFDLLGEIEAARTGESP